MMRKSLGDLLHARRGHFQLESGHHGELWLDLELLFERPQWLDPHVRDLARQINCDSIDAVCGPLVEGSFTALMVARRLDVEFFYTQPVQEAETDELFPVSYQLPDVQRSRIENKRVVIVNDVINAGSAVRGTYAELIQCHAKPVAMAALLTLGEPPQQLADKWQIELCQLESWPNSIWTPSDCPLCSAGEPLEVL